MPASCVDPKKTVYRPIGDVQCISILVVDAICLTLK